MNTTATVIAMKGMTIAASANAEDEEEARWIASKWLKAGTGDRAVLHLPQALPETIYA